jgi:indolepyruvate decarboxylase
MNLTEYVFHRLRELGVDHTFGIPGDFVLPVYAVQEAVGMPTIVCAHEPGVGFAADAYARLKGLGVALVTYGPGALNTLNPVACAYAEQSPLLVISGGPEVALRRPELHLHHVVKTFESQLQIYREVTVDAAILDDPESAPATIDRVLRAIIKWKRPGYLEIPRDRVRSPVASPVGRLELVPKADDSPSLIGALEEAAGEIGTMLKASRRPVLYVGAGVRRHGLVDQVVLLAEQQGLPVVTDLLGKSAFPESHPQYAGLYLGALGDPAVRGLVDSSDCVLGIGVALTDLGTGFWTQRIDPKARVMIDPDSVQVRYHHYDGLPMTRVVETLLERFKPRKRPGLLMDSNATDDYPIIASPLESLVKGGIGPATATGLSAPGEGLPTPTPAVIRVAEVIDILKSLDQSKYSFVADVGDSWFISLELRFDVFVAAGYYSSMGFAVPAALGVGIAEPSRRPLAIVGDGAFQMTGTELATLVDQKLRPIILLLNNGGYGMLEAIDGPRSYYERRNWNFPALARALGAEAEQVSTAGDLKGAFQRAEAAPGAYLIEALTARDDLSPVMARIRTHIKSAWQVPAAL